jgi:hypothetical protein
MLFKIMMIASGEPYCSKARLSHEYGVKDAAQWNYLPFDQET